MTDFTAGFYCFLLRLGFQLFFRSNAPKPLNTKTVKLHDMQAHRIVRAFRGLNWAVKLLSYYSITVSPITNTKNKIFFTTEFTIIKVMIRFRTFTSIWIQQIHQSLLKYTRNAVITTYHSGRKFWTRHVVETLIMMCLDPANPSITSEIHREDSYRNTSLGRKLWTKCIIKIFIMMLTT